MPGINNGGVANYLTLGVRMLCSLLVLSLRGLQFPSAERVGTPVLFSPPICALLAQRKWESAYEHSVARQTKPVSGGSLEKIQGTFSGMGSCAQPAC